MSRRLVPLALFAVLVAAGGAAWAQSINVDLGQSGSLTGRVVQLIAMITVISLAPGLLVMVTSFTRIVVVLSLLRTAMGVQGAPPNIVLVALALFLTAFVMGPTFDKAYQDGVRPFMDEEITEVQAFERTVGPVRDFMLSQVREKDLGLFMELAREPTVEGPENTPLRALVPAFMVSELRRAFEIGFLLFIPFLVIDMVVSSILMSMGMMMLPPVLISLPFKLIFFVLVDGWSLVAGSLVKSFGTIP
ncbi:MAG: flagellar type III secretion system pore protein FliP [Alphaproteobacteria bacterium]|nr:flagellar type III secretion system pore protein FliP [Alphaproteobacteria bacterium]